MHTHRAWWIAIVFVVTIAAGAWFFALRPSPPSSAFVRAFERYAAAVGEIREGAGEVSRFLDLPEYQATVVEQLIVMRRQTLVFQRLMRTEDGEAGRIARAAEEAAQRGAYSARMYTSGVLNRRLTMANRANGEMGAAVADLNQLAIEWKHLSD